MILYIGILNLLDHVDNLLQTLKPFKKRFCVYAFLSTQRAGVKSITSSHYLS